MWLLSASTVGDLRLIILRCYTIGRYPLELELDCFNSGYTFDMIIEDYLTHQFPNEAYLFNLFIKYALTESL